MLDNFSETLININVLYYNKFVFNSGVVLSVYERLLFSHDFGCSMLLHTLKQVIALCIILHNSSTMVMDEL